MTTHKCRDASAFYSLRQHLLCVIAPSPTRFTPYILSSSHLPHLQLPLCHPLTPSLSFFSLYLTTLFSSSSHLPSSPSSSICFYPSSSFAVAAGLRCSCTDIAQGLPLLLFSPLDCGPPPPISISPNPPVAACVFPLVLLDVSVLDNRSLDCYRRP